MASTHANGGGKQVKNRECSGSSQSDNGNLLEVHLLARDVVGGNSDGKTLNQVLDSTLDYIVKVKIEAKHLYPYMENNFC
jgi:hypothetical protein